MAAKPQGKEKFKAPLKGTPKHTSPPSSRVLYLIMALVTVVILVGGYLFYHSQAQQIRQRIEGGLSIVAQLKAEQIAEWRTERLVDADMLVGSPFFAEGVERYMASPTDTEAKDKVLYRLAVIEKAYPYQDILLVDVNGKVLLSLNDSVRRLSDVTLAQLPVAIKEHKAVMVDFHYPPDGNSPHLDVIAPLFPWGQDSPQAIGAVVFCIDPSQYLYPLLQSWSMPSETAEILLVERDGDQVLFLNELRHQKDTALKLRIPLSQQETPAVMAVTGKEGVVEGRDYRGVEVLSALKHIPDSPWYMVAKIDTSEVLSTWSFRAGIIIVSVAGLLAAALAFTGLIWQRRQRLVYQALYQAELESQALRGHFEYLVKYANDIIFLTDENYHIVEVNDRAVETYGYTRQEMLGMPLAALMPPGDLPSYQSRLRKIQQKGKIVAEGIHQRKDGSTFPVEVSGRTIKIEDKTYLQEIVRDITERKAREQEYQAIIHAAIDGFWQADMQGHFLDVNDAYCHLTGYSRDELLNMSISDIEAIETSREIAKRIRKIEEVGYDRFETHHRRKDGEIVDVEISVNYLPIDGGRMFVFIRDITERMDMEESLRLSEQNFRDSIENSPLGIRIANEDGKTFYTNRALLDIYGYSSIEELEAVPRKQRYIPGSYDEHRERTKKRRQGEFVPTNYEISIVRKDGDVRHLAASRGEVLWDDEKQFQVVYQDITERKQAEEKLRESEEKYQALFELGLEAVFLIDNQTSRILEVNAAASDMYGYSREELLAMRNTDLSAEPEDTKKVTTSTPKGSVIVPLRFHRRKDGSVFPVEISGRFFTWKEHSVHVAAIRDITERKQAEEALQESEEKYRSLVERANEGICIIQDGIVEYLNPRLAEMWSGTVKEFIGTPFIKHLHPDNLRKITGLYKRRVAGKDVTPIYEITLIRKDGSKLDVEVNAGVISYKGKPADLVVIRDITERKMAEEERKQLELKAQITSRLASVGEMAAGVAHEINNPLTAVTGYAQLLVGREDIPSDIRSDLEAINDGARRVAGIVRTLLAFSRQTKPQRKLVDINELIESTLILRAYHLRVNNIEVVTRLATDVLETVADPGQIQQVLLNLIVNAEMEMKLAHGKGKLTITTKKSHNTIKICCQDNGPGIKPKVMDKIFDPFFTTREVGQGTGLGLSLCYGIVAEHKGKIYAESKPGKGATFIVELPVVTEVAPPKPAKPDVKKSKKAVKARILVVDDEQVVRDVVNRVLTGEGHKVEIADNAADALNKIESKRYKLILVDIKMPGIDGVELYKRIQKINKSLARRVVFITGDIMGADTEKFLAETKVAHIDKPFNAEQLSREVQRALTAGR